MLKFQAQNPYQLKSIKGRVLIWYLFLIILTGIMLIWVFGLEAGLRYDVPFTYVSDGLEYSLLIKTMLDHGWWYENPDLSAPGTLQMYDYPIGNNLDFLIMKLFSLGTQKFGLIMNIYYLLTFFLTSIASMLVLRYLKISPPLAVMGSILYAFLYYHIFRIFHFNLIAYYMIPFMILVLIWVARGDAIWTREVRSGATLCLTKKGLFSIITLLLISTHAYYGFFGGLLLIPGIFWAFSKRWSFKAALDGLIAVLILFVGGVVNKLPSLIYESTYGPSPLLSARTAVEAEKYGLKLIQLFLPNRDHRIPLLADITDQYNAYHPLVNENMTATIGILGSIGLVLLLLWVFIRSWPLLAEWFGWRVELMDQLSVFTFASILIGTIGGFSAIIAIFFPVIHAYCRLSLYIAFLSICALCIMLQVVYERYQHIRWFPQIFIILILLLGVGGVLDQSPASTSIIPDGWREKQYEADEVYFGSIQSVMPKGSAIFILPDIGGFPQSDTPGIIGRNAHIRAYLHTSGIRWSYPAIKGREWERWQAETAALPPDKLLDRLYKTGFSGLLIDGHGYQGNGTEIKREYTLKTRLKPLDSEDSRYAFFDLRKVSAPSALT